MAYEVVVKDGFLKDFFELPRAVQAGAQRSIDQFYRDPFRVPDVKRVFKHQYNNVYRLRVGGRYRLIYAVGGKVVSLLAVGPRGGSIYDRFRAAAETSVTSGEIRAAGPPQPAPPYRTTPLIRPPAANTRMVPGRAPRRPRRPPKKQMASLRSFWSAGASPP